MKRAIKVPGSKEEQETKYKTKEEKKEAVALKKAS